MTNNNRTTDPGSFRDPAGVVFMEGGEVFRQINKSYQRQYDKLISSGLYDALVKDGLLVPHEATDKPLPYGAYLIIRPQKVPFISYAYEWCFGQMRDAALTTLKIHRKAIDYGMMLKDASAFNIQFMSGRPLMIDTLSFEMYREGSPWVAYGQFCRHFLAPLYLMSYVDVRLSQLLRCYIDGIPLDLTSRLLGSKGGVSALQHIKWHAKASTKNADAAKTNIKQMDISKFAHTAMIDSLIRIVEKLEIKGLVTEWGEYYKKNNYTDNASENKKAAVSRYLEAAKPLTVWDFGANDGTYSRIALEQGAQTVAFDIDPVAVERNYTNTKRSGGQMLPLLFDLTNPTPSIGFANRERQKIDERQHPDCILALALIHHLAISNNLPLDNIAEWLSEICEHLIIEFVPKEDSQAKILLATRDDVFPNYTKQGFEQAFSRYFNIIEQNDIEETYRTLYLMETKNPRKI